MTRFDHEVGASLVRDARDEFNEGELDGLPETVKRFFRACISLGTPLFESARIQMKGQIKIGRWIPFRAEEVLSPHTGFVWAARAGGIITGSDRFVDGQGEMNWKLGGLVTVMSAGGPDISRSAAERAAAEAVWVPTTLLPRFGVEWKAHNDNRISARYQIADYPVEIAYLLSLDGLARSVIFQRWGDPGGNGEFGLYAFGGDFTGYRTFHGLTIPVEGRFGWHFGTDRWNDGEFFRYHITALEPYEIRNNIKTETDLDNQARKDQ